MISLSSSLWQSVFARTILHIHILWRVNVYVLYSSSLCFVIPEYLIFHIKSITRGPLSLAPLHAGISTFDFFDVVARAHLGEEDHRCNSLRLMNCGAGGGAFERPHHSIWEIRSNLLTLEEWLSIVTPEIFLFLLSHF